MSEPEPTRLPAWLARFGRPREGWLSLFLLLVMLSDIASHRLDPEAALTIH